MSDILLCQNNAEAVNPRLYHSSSTLPLAEKKGQKNMYQVLQSVKSADINFCIEVTQ